MQLPTIAFSMDDETYLAERIEDGVTKPPEKFGPDFGGAFKLKWPTLADQGRISARSTAYWQAQGVSDPSGVALVIQQLVYALFFFEVLATQKPAWVAETTQDSPKFRRAMMRALVMAQERIGEEKKTSDDAGANTSKGS